MASDAEAANGAGAVSGAGGVGPGRLLAGRYRLRTKLGHGGMGTVWLAEDELTGEEVAVKEPRVTDTLNEHERAVAHSRVEREALATARIDHPSVVTIHEVVKDGGRPWIVMEFVRGRSLADVLLAEGTVSPPRAARIALPVLGALAAAHEAGVLHRDVKPSNVLLGCDGRVVLTDFGVARIDGERSITEAGAIVGSPEYLAPERALWRPAGPESDLWSLGVLLFETVQGWSPFLRRSTLSTLQAIASDHPRIPDQAGPLIPLIMSLLNKEPADRPGVPAIEQALRAVAATDRAAPSSSAPPPLEAVPGRTVRRGALAALGALVALVLFALGFTLLRRG
jgi:eukaryotic-like serine/threonine-protein kinase